MDRFSEDQARVESYLSVRQPNVERDNPTVDYPRLTKIAESTGGKVWQLNQLGELRATLKDLTRQNPRSIQKPLWNTWLVFLVLVGLLTVEWALRKWWNLR